MITLSYIFPLPKLYNRNISITIDKQKKRGEFDLQIHLLTNTIHAVFYNKFFM